ncbi:hypothetical protein N7492_006056 [Penicillium capsulatum]|uniref:Rhodopsin domain-containing protein n=1 Tax=Penicillium capsulatum TaxID=69766 RepID=A0A9W9LMB5_9EURO|nr:hypothetical protein N7492_006056 [Penicillium capsulatum]KAJ6103543.1 hypothetical protein N7512_010623 [Penicillium capsulatum]KAJ6108706.1 hypothetical protein N7512_008543 [Penicillium capsulatum]KAJ6113200.1 hypothetical protein N7512_008524 [Penicillium capsulatum]
MKAELRDTWTPAVNVLTWFMLVVSILSVLIRLGTKYWIFRKLTIDDVLSVAAMVFCIAQSIAVSTATAGGLGQHLDTLSESQKNSMMKSQYAATILFIVCMCCSKLSFMFFVRNLTPAKLDRLFAYGLGGFVILWTIVGIFSAAFQCQVPHTWDYLHGKCFNLMGWWDYLGATNILSECGIIAQVLLVIVRVQADLHKKVTLASVFLLRIVVVVAIICQLGYAGRLKNSHDPSWDAWAMTICTQMVQALSILTACSPQFKPVLDSLRSSGMGVGGSSYASRQRTYAYGTHYKASRAQRTNDTRSDTHELVPLPEDGRSHTVVTSTPDCDAESQTSETQIIRETRTWQVTESRRDS